MIPFHRPQRANSPLCQSVSYNPPMSLVSTLNDTFEGPISPEVSLSISVLRAFDSPLLRRGNAPSTELLQLALILRSSPQLNKVCLQDPLSFLPLTLTFSCSLGGTYYYGMRISPMITETGSNSSKGSAYSEYTIWRKWDDCLWLQDLLEYHYTQMAREKRTRLGQFFYSPLDKEVLFFE
jgi:hypothetical protein